ncbi:hypothetical protein ANN_03038 [Periplaneta americana]|uniref:Uncharacterized protein n=1 Tax=Periplaneta americana TaxID=6978 RepID=A0ABQ8TXX8_PERAM|nr:hypothetical protein ANN_03038 [Periplaneta americana]
MQTEKEKNNCVTQTDVNADCRLTEGRKYDHQFNELLTLTVRLWLPGAGEISLRGEEWSRTPEDATLEVLVCNTNLRFTYRKQQQHEGIVICDGYLASEGYESDNAGEMSPGSSTESYPAFAHIGLRENPGKNLNQGFVKDITYTQKPRNIDELRLKITQTFQQITPLILQRTWAELHHRYELCRYNIHISPSGGINIYRLLKHDYRLLQKKYYRYCASIPNEM